MSVEVHRLKASVAIVVPVWNQSVLLRRLLETVSRQTYAPTEVLVIDNGSKDDAPAVAISLGARVIAMGRNAGFAAAVNRGIADTTAEWIALVNSDVELADNWLQLLLAAAIETDAWFACGKILNASNPGQIDGTFDLMALSGCAWRAGNGRPDSALFGQRRRIAMASATATLYRRELFARAGTFAEIYESYLEDADLAVRCAMLDLAGIYVPAAVCLHRGSASQGAWSERVVYLLARNQVLLVKRLFPDNIPAAWRWKVWFGQRLWGLLALRHGRLRAWLRGRHDAHQTGVSRVPLEAHQLHRVLTGSERDIARLQRASGYDLYWRLYFLITGAGAL